MPHEIDKLVHLLKQADSCMDWLSNHRIDLVTRVSRPFLPSGFWGDGQRANSVSHPEAHSSRVYLTFDDGPSPHTTPYLLEMLEKEGVKATFFLIGKEAERYPELVEAIVNGGHSIGNHSHSHLFMPGLSTKLMEREIERTNQCVEEITGHAPVLFRPPYGMMDQRTKAILSERSMHAVYWTQAPEDWTLPGSRSVVSRVLMKLSPGSLIVLHEGKILKQQTLTAANEIIYRCKSSELSLSKVELRA